MKEQTTNNNNFQMARVIIDKTKPKVIGGHLPVYWLKRVAIDNAKKFGGTVKKVFITW